MRKRWHWTVFIAALFAAGSLVLMLAYELPENQMLLIERLDFAVLVIFAVDLFNEYRNWKGSGIKFTREHWLDIIAVVPLFRIVRIGRLAKLEKLAKLEEIVEVEKGIEAETTVSKSIHATHLKENTEE